MSGKKRSELVGVIRRWIVLAIVGGGSAVWLAPHDVIGQTAPSADEFPIAVPIEGEPFSGKLAAIDSDWHVRFQAADANREFDVRDLVRWGGFSDFAKKPQIVLADGGVAVGELTDWTDDELVAFSSVFGELRIPLALVRGIVFQPSLDPAVRDRRYFELLEAKGATDVLMFDNGDVLAGSIASFQPATDEQPVDAILVAVEGRQVRVETSRLAAVLLNPALIESPPRTEQVWLGFSDGSLLAVTRLQAEGGNLRLTVSGKIELAAEAAIWQDVTYIRPRGERLTFLSDLEPVGYKLVPLLEAIWPLGIDRSVGGGRLRSGGQLFSKGLGMHSISRVAFDLDGRFQRFAAELAVDQQAGSAGSVQFRVFLLDAAGAWKPAFASPVIRGGERPRPISIDVTAARRLALIVEDADRGSVSDHANWLDARLISVK